MCHAPNNQAGCGPGLAVLGSLEGKVFEVAGHPSVFASPGSHCIGRKTGSAEGRNSSVCRSPDPSRPASAPLLPRTQHPRRLSTGPRGRSLDPFTRLSSTGESTPPVRPAAEGSLTPLPVSHPTASGQEAAVSAAAPPGSQASRPPLPLAPPTLRLALPNCAPCSSLAVSCSAFLT